MNPYPTECNLCGGRVIYTSNSRIYGGREYGSGACYLCTQCRAYVGTHIPRPTEALGILADRPMREMKKKCHDLFDKKWINKRTEAQKKEARKRSYKELANYLQIPVSECHFGYFDMDMLNKAYEHLKENDYDRE